MPSLIMISPAPLIETPAGEVILDVRFVEGMKLHCQLWPGPVRCVMWRGAVQIEAPMRYAAARLGFDLIALDPGAPVPDLLLDEASMVYVAADDMKHLTLPQAMRGRMGKVVYTVEEALGGRVAHALGISPSVRRRLGSLWWALSHERGLRAALRAADGIHCNGYPADESYHRLNRQTLRYFDNRMRTPMIARSVEQDARAETLRRNEPLRLAWFGTMTRESGVMDLLPMSHLLAQAGVPFTLSLFGEGPLEARLRDGIDGLGLDQQVSLSAPPPFEPVLVPRLRREADLFVQPRRLPDPQGAYVEALGCGLPILGYANRMWRRMQRESGAGWAVAPRPAALAAAVTRLHGDREAVIRASGRAVEFARANAFETVFARRMTHLRDIAGMD